MIKRLEQDSIGGHVQGWLHEPFGPPHAAMGLTHGAGGNAEGKLLVAVADVFAAAGYLVLRYDLPFRQKRPKGPPSGKGVGDRDGIVQVARTLRELAPGVPVYLAGQSYGGRQSSMVAAEHPDACDGLVLLSYPLHPPGKPDRLRTEHFPSIRIPTMFVHGTRDPFGSPDALEEARKLLGGKSTLHIVDGAGHGVPPASVTDLPGVFEQFITGATPVRKK